MRRLLAIAAGLAGLACWGQAASGVALIDDDVLRRNGTTAPFFSFASPTAFRGYAAYTGLPATDGCKAPATITGTKGEALTFTRATASSCCTTSDCSTIEQCTSGQACIQSGSTGLRGLRVNRGYTESILRTEEFDNAAWTKNAAGVSAAPTVTSDFAAAPDGTTTAERIQFDACSAITDASGVLQNFGGGAVAKIASVWLKANSGNPSVSVCSFGAAGTGTCVATALTSSWVRYSTATWTSAAPGSAYLNFGCEHRTALYSGASNTGTADVLAWGGNGGDGAYPAPYVKATSAAVTVNAETALFTTTAPSQPASLAATFTGSVVAPGAGGREYVMARTGAADYFAGRSTTAAPTTLVCAANTATRTTTTIASGSRVACYSSSAGIAACLNGTCTAVTGSPAVSANGTAVYLGYDPDNANWQADGLISNVCLDSTTTGCR